MKKQINVSIDIDDYNIFMRLYRGCLTRFIQNVVKKAVNDKDFFSNIFFGEVKK